MEPKIICIGGSILTFVTIIITALCLGYSYHTIEEGNVGVYFIRGRLDDTYSNPGVNWMAPFVTDVYEVRTRAQTDIIDPLTTFTQDGNWNQFSRYPSHFQCQSRQCN